MENLYKTITYKNHTINIIYDPDPQNPRTEWDNLGKMICFHNRYDLGDKHNYQSPIECAENINEKTAIILPLYLYDHSGPTINTTGFSCPWDSGQVGIIYVTKTDIRKEYGWKRLSKKRKALINQYLGNEVEIYDYYLKNEVFGYSIMKLEKECPMCQHNEAEEIDSCWGFYGTDFEGNGLLEQAKGCIG